jgi:hypothetical protein
MQVCGSDVSDFRGMREAGLLGSGVIILGHCLHLLWSRLAPLSHLAALKRVAKAHWLLLPRFNYAGGALLTGGKLHVCPIQPDS